MWKGGRKHCLCLPILFISPWSFPSLLSIFAAVIHIWMSQDLILCSTNSRRKKQPWQNARVAVHVTGIAGALALSHVWDCPLIPRAGSVLKITWPTSEMNIQEGYFRGFNSSTIYQVKNKNNIGCTFREHCTSRIAEIGQLRLLIFSTAYKAKPCTSFSTFRINLHFLHY